MRAYDGVIFDMDGTLVHSPLDFAMIRRELGVRGEDGILEHIDTLDAARRPWAHGRLLQMEMEAARQATLAPHAGEALAAVRTAGLKTALLTRNNPEVVQLILQKFPVLRFDIAWSRDDGPIKPEPDGILKACRLLGIEPARTACVGDFRLDVLAANAAGAVSILLVPEEPPDYARDAHHTLRSLAELPALLGIA